MNVAIVIAIENYSDPRLQPVEFAERDGLLFAEALEPHGYSSANCIILVNQQATKSSVESRVKRVLKQLTADDELLFFFSGHGFAAHGVNHLACYDTDLDDLADTSIDLNRLCQQWKESDCARITCFLDSTSSGIPIPADFRDVFTERNDAELEGFFSSDNRLGCFVSCRAKESSYSSGTLRHGIWAYHVVAALSGAAPTALVASTHLTAASLQSYLQREIPRTLAKTFAAKKAQTPWMAGDGNSQLADLREVLAKRKKSAQPAASSFKNVTLLKNQSRAFRSLSGFKKTYKEPERANDAADAFVGKLSSEEIAADIKMVFAQLKSAFRFKRADMPMTEQHDGAGTITTPYFNYSISVRVDPEDTSQVIFRRSVDAIKEADRVLSPAFAEVFQAAFDTVEFDTPSVLDLPALIDRMEGSDDDRIALDYDPEVTRCVMRIAGTVGAIILTSRSVSIVHKKAASPQDLLESFFEIQRLFLEDLDIKLIS